MTVSDILGSLLIGPLKLIFELIFSAAYKIIGHPGVAIVFLSLAMNILVLPLYRRADAIQMEARDTENRLKDVVAHIKKTFSGDERMMILQTYYRQNNYSSLAVLKSSISLLLQIPFFMAAYQFLSNLDVLQGVSFGVIADLGKADGLLTIGSMSVNVLPIIMTLVNVVSSSLYLKGFPLKTKIQLYGMAAFFLVFLYKSPAALVLYWTLNNVFSLIKTIFYRIKNSKKIVYLMLFAAGIGSIALGIAQSSIRKAVFLIALGVIAQLPWMFALLKKKWTGTETAQPVAKPGKAFFVTGVLFLTVLVGLLIPSTYVGASPQEYIDIGYFYHPIWYVIHTLCLSAGTFLVWFSVFYWLANNKGKVIFSQLVWMASGILLINYMFFGAELGVVSPDLVYTDGFSFARTEQLINIAVILAAAIVLWLLARKFSKKLTTVLLGGAVAVIGMSVFNMVQIATLTEEAKVQLSESTEELPSFNLSKEGQNVVVIMLDRGINQFVPYMMEENPELLKQFDGFTHYANSLAYGGYTNFAAPALFGGYEYTPLNLNLRDDEYLVDKHNEALKVMPELFSKEGYDVTLIDPTYAGYSWIPDLSVFEDMEGVTAYHADGKFKDLQNRLDVIETRQRNFFFFSLMKTMPVSLQPALYDYGKYCTVPSANKSDLTPAFTDAYEVMENMESMTEVVEGDANTYMFLRSNLTHSPVILQEPTFEPVNVVDNSEYYSKEGKTITCGDESQLLSTKNQISHYHVNMASFIQLGKWFDYLRENDVYDNTRIIIVSDHGRNLGVFDKDEESLHDIEYYQSMLMVKDFDAHGFTTVEDFMTNADVPTMAMNGLIDDPVNPFTGKEINSTYKTENSKQYVIMSKQWSTSKNDGKQFLKAEWATVSGDVREKANWDIDTTLSVLPQDLTK